MAVLLEVATHGGGDRCTWAVWAASRGNGQGAASIKGCRLAQESRRARLACGRDGRCGKEKGFVRLASTIIVAVRLVVLVEACFVHCFLSKFDY